ncbi:Uncharacterised protein [Vibrio cholerae]|uniref:Uncharacterized protein n=1 Tax=Vibrio cholerae TaxID=666 RepID=A0A655RNU2_VIBCL|nr:Uncharacterised protein [Vibrio cholerae]CRZ60081.1 Uncharacterised protein [Vibrio cholerae]CRZ88581.1 Uncharacterised protein [Vibrio cholerae]CSA90370.1 Uncharacterised protein [Vibrio cholerae]CSB07279.1 Uncharacterised protein [Vibrio cholerae]
MIADLASTENFQTQFIYIFARCLTCHLACPAMPPPLLPINESRILNKEPRKTLAIHQREQIERVLLTRKKMPLKRLCHLSAPFLLLSVK